MNVYQNYKIAFHRKTCFTLQFEDKWFKMKWRIQFLSGIIPISSAQQSHDHGQLFWTEQLSLRVNLSSKANTEGVKKSEKCITISEMPFLLCHKLHAGLSHRPTEFGSLEVIKTFLPM